MTARATKAEVFMTLAHAISQRGTCSRLKVGAVVVRDDLPLSLGYNGAARGLPHCPPLEQHPKSCTNSVHAEANAIISAARLGVGTSGATLYCTHAPCARCSSLIINAGIARVVYDKDYGDPPEPILFEAGIDVYPNGKWPLD